jgi:adenylate cyclase
VQNAMVERNAGVPEDRRIVFRMGIHIGDVVEESDGDLMGDGVNIAARLEGIAKPGAVCLSEDAYRQVSGRLDMQITDLGPTQLKNIAKSIRVYSLQVGVPAQAKRPEPKNRSALALLASGIAALLIVIAGGSWYFLGANRPATVATKAAAPVAAPPGSIVVLPFVDLSDDPAQQYLADVLTEGLTTTLAQYKGTFVIARSTAFTYKGKSVDVKEIGRELGVRYVLEGSEQHSGGKVRVNAQLIDAETGAHLSAEQFDADQSDLLEMQDEIVTRIARGMGFQLVAADVGHAARTRSGNLETDDLALRCLAASIKPETWGAGVSLCQQALQVDDRNVRAMFVVSLSYSLPVIDAQSIVARCFRVADALEVGRIGINSGAVSYAGAPFGGVKDAGLGREGSHHGIDEFLEMKTLHFGGL